MKRRTFAVFLAIAFAVSPALAMDPDSPHLMTKPNGEADTTKCGACHESDMRLSRSKKETCTLCHAINTHAGSAEHINAAASSVALLASPGDRVPGRLPLTETGQIFCGTCHLFHDQKVMPEGDLLSSGWIPPDTGIAGGVRAARTKEWPEIASRTAGKVPGASFATEGTRWLRLGVEGGQLCLQCHGGMASPPAAKDGGAK